MNISDVLTICKGKPWRVTNTRRLRLNEDGRCYCPITYAFFVKTGAYVSEFEWQVAAVLMCINYEEAKEVVAMADSAPVTLLSMIED